VTFPHTFSPAVFLALYDSISCSGIYITHFKFPSHHTRDNDWLATAQTFINELLAAGDTLFSMGCGRLFEGTPPQMFNSLAKLQKLPLDTMSVLLLATLTLPGVLHISVEGCPSIHGRDPLTGGRKCLRWWRQRLLMYRTIATLTAAVRAAIAGMSWRPRHG